MVLPNHELVPIKDVHVFLLFAESNMREQAFLQGTMLATHTQMMLRKPVNNGYTRMRLLLG